MTDQRNEDDDNPIVDIDHLLDAIEATIATAPAAKRATLARALAAHMNDCPVEHFWTIGPQAAEMLHLVMNASSMHAATTISPNSRATFA
jgi:hypothetical protein